MSATVDRRDPRSSGPAEGGRPLQSALYVEDRAELSAFVCGFLEERHISVAVVVNLAAARDLLVRQHFDVVLLDLKLDNEDGLDLIRDLGASGPPIIVTSARADEVDRLMALELGADDYLVKPFSLHELLARMKAVHRRARAGRPRTERVARWDRWVIDLAAHQARDEAGRCIDLTSGELLLLRVFLERPGRLFARHELLALTRRGDEAVFERTIDVLVTRIRRKLEGDPRHPALIETVRGSGYRLAGRVVWETVVA